MLAAPPVITDIKRLPSSCPFVVRNEFELINYVQVPQIAWLSSDTEHPMGGVLGGGGGIFD